MQPVVLDTDVASLPRRRKPTGPLATGLIGREPLITFITFGELAKWAEIRRWGTHRRGELAAWLSGVPVLPGDPVAVPDKQIMHRLSVGPVGESAVHEHNVAR